MSAVATQLHLAAHMISYVIALPLMILGIIGVILSIIVFTGKVSFRHNTTINYLLAGSVHSGIHIIVVDIQTILAGGFDLGIFDTSPGLCREHTYLRYVTTVSTICFPCWAAFDQYVGTSHNAAVRNRWQTLRFVRLAIVGTSLFWTLIYIPIIFTTETISGTCQIRQTSYKTFNTFVLTPLVHTIIPAAVMIYYTRGTIKNLRSVNVANTHEHLEKQVRRMLMPQLFFLAVSGIPFGLEEIYFYLTTDAERGEDRIALEKLLDQIILLFYHLNFTFTFYVYISVSSKVRKVLRQQILQCLGKFQLFSRNVKVRDLVLLQEQNRTATPVPN